ncbi:peptidyl-tRNA hydrolase domain-containing protein [Anopheles sinensis]|uniref:Peptidyl-tRNA hydrolase domain-containing protein n=1 Tax=Anopheles sinensis TaxID=74873 RepID=A0A084WQR6_ANOSI|nr:peptidyl-tRNA hydrolase domain-containing protein [Anopheles sinensis]
MARLDGKINHQDINREGVMLICTGQTQSTSIETGEGLQGLLEIGLVVSCQPEAPELLAT